MVKDNPKRFPEFFTVYLSAFSSERMLISKAFVDCVNGGMPKHTSLSNNSGMRWPVQVVKTEKATFFQSGWKSFVKDNSIKEGEFLVFRFTGDLFYVRVFERSMCEKIDPPSRDKGVELVEGKEEEHDSDTEEEEDDDDDDYEGGGDDDEACRVFEHSMSEKIDPPSRDKGVELVEVKEEEHDSDTEEEEDDDYEGGGDDDDDEACRVFEHSMSEKIDPPSRDKGVELVEVKEEEHDSDTEEEDDDDDYEGVDVDDEGDVDEGGGRLFNNPYFIALYRPGNRCKLRVPVSVIKDNNLVLARNMIYQYPDGSEWPGEVSIWTDGSTWIGGWGLFCKKNNIRRGDQCICEIVLDRGSHWCRGFTCSHRCAKIKVQIIRGRAT